MSQRIKNGLALQIEACTLISEILDPTIRIFAVPRQLHGSAIVYETKIKIVRNEPLMPAPK